MSISPNRMNLTKKQSMKTPYAVTLHTNIKKQIDSKNQQPTKRLSISNTQKTSNLALAESIYKCDLILPVACPRPPLEFLDLPDYLENRHKVNFYNFAMATQVLLFRAKGSKNNEILKCFTAWLQLRKFFNYYNKVSCRSRKRNGSSYTKKSLTAIWQFTSV